ncbi:ABC transporter permease [Chiayiivirga flava]|nr:ABC transporter permease [Chiayiivirga flava]
MPDKLRWRRSVSLCRLFVVQDLRSRFEGSILGVAWTLVSPLTQLAVFYVVFLHIFKARVPGLAPDAYLAFLALGFWPWFAFSESVVRATTTLQDHAALAAKVALPKTVLVFSRVLSCFILHGIGFVAVLVVIGVASPLLEWRLLPVAVVAWVPLFAIAVGIGLLTASVQVFVRDLGQGIGPAMSLWFFLTPVIYSADMGPPALQAALYWNPIASVVEAQRLLLFPDASLPGWQVLALSTIFFPSAGIWIFRRLEPWFEDYA